MRQQIVLAARRLRREPSFAVTAVVTLALGMAATTTLFTMVYGTLIRPLPYLRAQEIYAVRTTMTDGRFTIGLLATAEMMALRHATPAVTASALLWRQPDTVALDGQSRQIADVSVTEGFFDLFGVPMAAGRPFGPEDHQSSAFPSGVLSYAAWRNLFGGSDAIVGQTLRLGSGQSVRVVGVAGQAFDVPHDVDLWIARHFGESVAHSFDAYIRIAPGASPASIAAAMQPSWSALAAKYPDFERNRAFVFRPLLETIVGDLGPIALIAFAATGLLLLLAIANVSNLLLAQGATRLREVAVQAALGASRAHLFRQFLAESLVLTLLSAAVSVPLAAVALRALAAIGGLMLPRADSIRVDPVVLAFGAAVFVVTAVLISLVPAMTATRVSLAPVLNEGGRSAMHGRLTRRMLGAMIVVEVALAIALVAGAARLFLSMRQLTAVDPGFIADGRMVVDVYLPKKYASASQAVAWTTEVEARLRALGATHVGVTSTVPLAREWDMTVFVDIVGRPTEPQYRPSARIRWMNPDLLAAMGTQLAAGRSFDEVDRQMGRPVVLVNEAWARKFLSGLDPLRERVLGFGFFGHRDGSHFVNDPADIVGVVKDVRYAALAREAEPMLYLTDSMYAFARKSLIVTTADGRPERLASEIRAALKHIDPEVPVEIQTLSQVVRASLVWSRLGALLMGMFGAIALVLASVGVFGVIAYVVSQRLPEMAVRLALGASPTQVFALVMRQGGRLIVEGVVAGVVLAWWLGRLMAEYVYQVSAANATVLAGSAAIVLLLSMAAMFPSARRAAAVGPAAALRS
jgi:predicted permease